MVLGGRPLRGTVQNKRCKEQRNSTNSCCDTCRNPVTLDNLPHLSDVAIYTEILKELGATIDWNEDQMTIDPSQL